MVDVKRLFTPEFRKLADAIVNFRALDEEIILRVVDKFLLNRGSAFAEKKVEVTFTTALRKHLAKKGFDPLDGRLADAARLIQDTISTRAADELLFGRPSTVGDRPSTSTRRARCSSTSSARPQRAISPRPRRRRRVRARRQSRAGSWREASADRKPKVLGQQISGATKRPARDGEELVEAPRRRRDRATSDARVDVGAVFVVVAYASSCQLLGARRASRQRMERPATCRACR